MYDKLVKYDSQSGKFYSLTSNSNVKVGEEPKGSVDSKGYVRIGVCGKLYRAHRLAFLCMGVELPVQVDHKDMDKTNNSWDNLRPSTNQTNQWNTKKRVTNTSGHKNVFWRPERNHWQVRIATKDNPRKYIGSYKDFEEAVKAATAARIEHQQEFSNHV